MGLCLVQLERLRRYGEPVLPSRGEVFQGLKRDPESRQDLGETRKDRKHCDFRSLHGRNTYVQEWLEDV